jgi:hypothetical protein
MVDSNEDPSVAHSLEWAYLIRLRQQGKNISTALPFDEIQAEAPCCEAEIKQRL